jgi:hypothetical protein
MSWRICKMLLSALSSLSYRCCRSECNINPTNNPYWVPGVNSLSVRHNRGVLVDG